MFKQPRVPEYRESEGVGKYLKALTLFLKDFCQDAWVASGQAHKSIDAIRYPVTSVNGETGDVQLETIANATNAEDAKKLSGKTWKELLLELHPIGSLYLSADSASPADLFGGEWEQMKDCFLVAAGDTFAAGAEGGKLEHTHGLTQAHAAVGYSMTSDGGWVDIDPSGVAFNALAYAGPVEYAEEDKQAYEVKTGAKLHGDTDAASNLPPYTAVNVWKRIA